VPWLQEFEFSSFFFFVWWFLRNLIKLNFKEYWSVLKVSIWNMILYSNYWPTVPYIHHQVWPLPNMHFGNRNCPLFWQTVRVFTSSCQLVEESLRQSDNRRIYDGGGDLSVFIEETLFFEPPFFFFFIFLIFFIGQKRNLRLIRTKSKLTDSNAECLCQQSLWVWHWKI